MKKQKVAKQKRAFVIDIPNKRSGVQMLFPFKAFYGDGEVSKVILMGDSRRLVKQIIVITEE